MLRKFLVILTALAIGTQWVITPALADPSINTSRISAGGLNTSTPFQIYAGEPNSIVYHCEDDDPDSVNTVTTVLWDPTATLPPGLSYDPTTVTISGTATTPGIYTFPKVLCHVESGGQSVDVEVWAAEIQVLPSPTPINTDYSQVTPGGHTSASVETLTVGTSVSIDYTCVDASNSTNFTVTTETWSNTPVLPQGLTYDETYHTISGIPSEAGTFPLPSMNCMAVSANGLQGLILDAGTIQVNDAQTPEPTLPPGSLTVMPSHLKDCGFLVEIVLPEGVTPDPNGVTLRFENGDRFVVLRSQNAQRHMREYFTVPGFDQIENRTDNWENIDQHGTIRCPGHFNYVHLTYSSGGEISETYSVENIELFVAKDRIEVEKFFSNGECHVVVDYQMAQLPDFDPVTEEEPILFTYEEENLYMSVLIRDLHHLDETGAFELNLDRNTFSPYENSEFDGSYDFSVEGHSMGCHKSGLWGTFYTTGGVRSGDEGDIPGLVRCDRGTYSWSGYDFPSSRCEDAPIGTYIDDRAATQPTPCPAGMTTEYPGSPSRNDCFKPIVQTFKTLTALKKMKFGQRILLPMATDQGVPMRVRVAGNCKAQPLVVNNVQRTKLVAAKRAGNCTLTLDTPTVGRYAPVAKTLKVKVTKTGK